ncbi:MAG: glycosyltransferase, partial [Gammaproteobacteria bacterium]|nr:glycosyltransferase [Gammaproteobacteria bacterium]
EKGIYELVGAVNILLAKKLDVQLFIAGEIYPDNPSSLSADEVNGFKSGEIKVLGHVDDIHALMEKCDIVVLPSFYREGTPRILIEAAAMEKPIVATDIAGCQGLVKDGVNGYLVPVRDVDALSTAIEKLVNDPELRKKMGQEGRKIVLDEFDDEVVIRKTLDVYGELCR